MLFYGIRIIAENHEISVVASYYVRTVTVGDKRIVFQIWDTAGQERFRSLVPMYLRDTKIAIMMYDITSVVSIFHFLIFTLPVFSATMNISKMLTSISPWNRCRDV